MGLVLQGCWSCLLIFSGTYGELLGLRDLRRAVVLRAHGRRPVRAARASGRMRNGPIARSAIRSCRPSMSCLCALIMVDLLIVKPVYTWPGLILVLTGIPVYFLVETQCS